MLEIMMSLLNNKLTNSSVQNIAKHINMLKRWLNLRKIQLLQPRPKCLN